MKSIKESVDQLTNTLLTNISYRNSWQANIAMAFKDEWQRAVNNGGLPCTPEQIHILSNKAADNFLNILCNKGD